jgi:Tat protein translocase TatB subunit
MYVHGHLTHPQRKWYQFMLDIAWPELIIIGIVAVVAIGPKDLPKVMNTMGRWAGKARNMAHDVQRSFDQLNFEAEAAERLKDQPPHAMHSKHHHTAPGAQPESKDEPHDHLGST